MDRLVGCHPSIFKEDAFGRRKFIEFDIDQGGPGLEGQALHIAALGLVLFATLVAGAIRSLSTLGNRDGSGQDILAGGRRFGGRSDRGHGEEKGDRTGKRKGVHDY